MDTAHTFWVGDTAQHSKKKLSCGWVGGGPDQKIMPLCGSILQAETCQILRMRIQDGAECGKNQISLGAFLVEANKIFTQIKVGRTDFQLHQLKIGFISNQNPLKFVPAT